MNDRDKKYLVLKKLEHDLDDLFVNSKLEKLELIGFMEAVKARVLNRTISQLKEENDKRAIHRDDKTT